jgi:hypothetical protein
MPNQRKQRDGDAPDPKSKGGRRSRHPNSLANLTGTWQKGVSGNPSGKSAALNDVIRYARAHSIEMVDKLVSIVRDSKAARRDQISAALAVLDRGCGKAIVPVFRTGNRLPLEMTVSDGIGGDGEWTPLLASAGRGPAGNYRRLLQEELSRLDAEEREQRAAHRDEIDEAREAMARGEEVSPLMTMLVRVKDETS